MKKEKRKKAPLTFVQQVRKLKQSGLEGSPPPNRQWDDGEPMDDLNARLRRILGIMEQVNTNPAYMVYFIMYDIEDNKVRGLVAKYLVRKGCARVQKSIFLANTERVVYDQIQSDLKEVQACYENSDSILLVPVSTDLIQAMKIIGKNIDLDLILKKRNTLFF